MDDRPATHVIINTAAAKGCGFLIGKVVPPASRIRLEGLDLLATLNTVTVGYVLGLDVLDCGLAAGGAGQGYSTLPVSQNYPIRVTRCKVTGGDCGAAFYRSIAYLDAVEIGSPGAGGFRDGIRFQGGTLRARNTTCFADLTATDCLIRGKGDGYGNTAAVDGLDADNESGGPRVAAFEWEQAPYCANNLTVNDVCLATMKPPGAFVRLIGHGGGIFQPGKAVVSRLTNVSGGTGCVLRCDGPGWLGSLDCGWTDTSAVAGDTAGIAVSPPLTGGPPP
jgi:hypothetical protein